MKNILFLILTYFFIATGCTKKVTVAEINPPVKVTPTPPPVGDTTQKQSLRVMTYNIHYASPPSKPGFIDIDAIVAVIKRENPDVVKLQEVDKLVPRSKNQDQAKLIANKLGMEYHFYKSINRGGGEYGLAILSKFKLSNIRHIILPQIDPKAENRSLAYADIIFFGQRITIACTHLDAWDEPTRLLQAKAIVKELEPVENPIILGGDLNSTIGSKSINYIQKHFKNSCTDNCGVTVPAVNPKRYIDYILTKNSNWKLKDYKVVNESYASDHRPVVVTFEVP